MEELTKFEAHMLAVIFVHTVYQQHKTLRVFERCQKSYDKTIYCLEKAHQLGIDPEDLC
jgi:hypothetical protein